VSDDLELPGVIRKECGFGTGGGVPGSATCARRQASVTLATEGVADQVRRVSRRYGNRAGSGWRRDLRRRVRDRAQGACKHKSGREQAPNSRNLTSIVAHFFSPVLLSAYRLRTVEVVKLRCIASLHTNLLIALCARV